MPTYQELLDVNSDIANIVPEKVYESMLKMGKATNKALSKMWLRQLKKNAKRFLGKHGLLVDNCGGFGTNKATILIGAGPSFNKNKEYLKKLCQFNAGFKFELQPFIFIASNHQYKPCLDIGIIPHFVILVDASDGTYDQLCTDIPKRGHATTLICSLHCSPKIITEWTNQGRLVQFYIAQDEKNFEVLKDVTGKDYSKKGSPQGGNVLNTAWVLAYTGFGSKVIFTVGNDLSYPIEDTVEKRREVYYADGDYSTNLSSKRDEAGKLKKWLGFELGKNIFTDETELRMKLCGTTQTLYLYKIWIELNILIQSKKNVSFHYYNCSEGGILGVVAKSYEKDDLTDKDNWCLLDEMAPNHWHTRTLEDAAMEFLAARKMLWQTQMEDAGAGVVSLPEMTAFANVAAQAM